VRKRKKIILLVVAAVVAAGAGWGYARAQRAILTMATETLTQVTGAQVTLRAVAVRLNGAMLIEDMAVRPTYQAVFDDAIFKAKYVEARLSLWGLVRHKVQLKKVSVRDFVVNVQYDANEARWNTETLKLLRTVGTPDRMPELRLGHGIIKYSKVRGGAASDVITLPVDATFKTLYGEKDTLSVDIRGAEGATLTGTWRTGTSGRVMLSGRVSTANVPLFENVWNMDKIAIVANYDANTVEIEDCRMQLGEVTSLSAKGRIADYRHRGVFDLQASIKNIYHSKEPTANAFVYSKSLLENLPGKTAQTFFAEFKPKGWVDIEVSAKGALNDLMRSNCEGKLYCKDVSVTYKDFPYEMEHIAGTIDFDTRGVVLNKLAARHKEAELVIEGYSRDFEPVWDCNLIITSPRMTLDNDLYNALDPDQKRAWTVISPQGHIGMWYNFRREPNGARRMVVKADLQGVDATYQQFQFSMRNMTGTMFLDLHNDRTVFENVVSEYEGRRIIINGWTKLKGQQWDALKSDNDIYCLSLDAAGLELEKDVAPLLPVKTAKVLAALKASGKVRIIAQMSSNAGEKCAPKSLAIECMGDSIDYAGLPYPLKDIRGKLSIVGDGVKFENIMATAATDANMHISLDGMAGFSEKGLQSGQFKIGAMNIAVDSRLGQLLGAAGQDIYKRLSPQGKADVNLDMLQIAKDGNDVNSVDVRGGVVFKQCGFSSMLPVSSLDGRLNFDASYKRSSGLKSDARVDINSMKVKGKLIQRLLADVGYDGTAGALNLKNISADFYGGKLVGDFRLAERTGDVGGYTLHALFEHIDLREFLAFESGETPDYISGLMSGEIDVNSPQRLQSGKVQMRITEMKVGKLSFFGKVLAALKLTEPQDYAFDTMIVTAYVRGNELMVEQMDLSSKAFALRGQGSVDIEKNSLNLQFIAAGPRLGKDAPMLESLAEGLSPAMARVSVTGDLKNPKVEQTTLPVIKDTLELLGAPKN
jgi:hypothetical protein